VIHAGDDKGSCEDVSGGEARIDSDQIDHRNGAIVDATYFNLKGSSI
jgi:hypothetical protein